MEVEVLAHMSNQSLPLRPEIPSIHGNIRDPSSVLVALALVVVGWCTALTGCVETAEPQVRATKVPAGSCFLAYSPDGQPFSAGFDLSMSEFLDCFMGQASREMTLYTSAEAAVIVTETCAAISEPNVCKYWSAPPY
jgi:hypothetical protein